MLKIGLRSWLCAEGENIAMATKGVSQKTIGAVARFLPELFNRRSDVRETLYENNFPDWFVRKSQLYATNWMEILMDLRRGTFFFPPNNIYAEEIVTLEGVTDDPH